MSAPGGQVRGTGARGAIAAASCLCAVALIAAALPVTAGGNRSQQPKNAALNVPQTPGEGLPATGQIDVAIYLSDQRALESWQSDRGFARRAAGIVADGRVFGKREASREATIRRLNSNSLSSSRESQMRALRLIEKAGGRVTGSLPAPNVVFARLPALAVTRLSASPLIQAIEPIGKRTYLNYSIIHGAEGSWHTAGCKGAGATDTCPATSGPQAITGPVNSPDGNGGPDVAVDDQGINNHHDAFDGGATPALGRSPAIVKPVGAPATNGSLHANTIAAAIAVKDPVHRGNAYGVDKILDPNAPTYGPPAWMLGLPTFNDPGRPGASDLPESINKSYFDSSENDLDDGYVAREADMEASQYGISQAPGAGNGGPYAYAGAPLRTCYGNPDLSTCQYRVQHPCVSYNALCMGAITNPVDTVRAHDVVADYSSRGPSVGGRKKPDLVSWSAGSWGCPNGEYTGAPDAVKDAEWKSGSICGEGTSYAAPFGAAGQLLLAGIGATAPAVQRAVLINSALMLDSEGDGDSAAQEYWTPDTGWGEIDFAQAYADRANWRTGQIDGASVNNARFFRVNGQSAGDRTTLAWNRRAILTDPWDFDTLGYTTTDLDLRQITLAGADNDKDVCGGSTTCGVDATETTDACPGFSPGGGAANVCAFAGSAVHKWKTTGDAIDTTEQVRATSTSDSIIKVTAATTVDGQAREDFALASTEPLVPLATPTIAAPAPTLSDSSVAENENVTVTAFATNESSGTDLVSGLDLAGLQVSINLPAGVSCVPSPCFTASLGALTTSQTKSTSWIVHATTSAAHQISFTATGTRFGETFASTSNSATLTADSQAPSINLSAPSGWRTSKSATVGWNAADPLAGVANVAIESSVNGEPWQTVYNGGDASGTSQVSGPEGAHVAVRARATDQQSNISPYAAAEWNIDADAPEIALNAPVDVNYGDSALVFVTAGNVGSAISTVYRVGGGTWQPVSAGVIRLASIRATTTVEVRVTDELGRETISSVRVTPQARPTTLSIRRVKRGANSRVHVATTPPTAGTFSIDARCARHGNKPTRKTRVFRSRGAGTITLGKRLGRCRVRVSFAPRNKLASQSARASRVLRL
ncbi:MAG: hypothetical protein HY827_09730 [Actinobacteria bacterium]|nr:hypothetical protein [Actinomycetota bacterium]